MKADSQALTSGVEGIAVAPGSLSDRLFIAKRRSESLYLRRSDAL